MNYYAGIDLHSNNSYIGIIDDNTRRIFSRRIRNDKRLILNALSPYKKEISGIVVESTYNWYWLVDSLMKEGHRVHLANPAAMQQYKGIKYLNDRHDAFWLAEMLKLKILPEGYIYPKEIRGIRDLLRLRSRLVRKRTSFKHMLQQITGNQAGESLSNRLINKMKSHEIDSYFEEEEWQIHGESLVSSIHFLAERIREIENYITKKMKGEWIYQELKKISGIGQTLGLTISLETGPIERFPTAEDYASYCRCVPTAYWSNEKKKGSGNRKNGNKYLAWAYGEAASFFIRYNAEGRKYYQRKSAKTNIPKAYRAIANKLAKACYYVMKDHIQFDPVKLFRT